MTNPARDLLVLVKRWRGSLSDSSSMASAFDPRQPKGSEQLALFYALAAKCDETLSELETAGFQVDLYRRQMVNWLRIPLGANGSWTKSMTRDQIIPSDWVDQIEHLALYLDGKVIEFPRELLGELDRIVDSALDLLAEDVELPDVLRKYIHDLLMSIRTAISHERVGLTFDFANACRHLYAAFVAAEGRSEKRGKFWSDLGRRIVFDGASHLTTSGLTAVATIALTAS